MKQIEFAGGEVLEVACHPRQAAAADVDYPIPKPVALMRW